MDDRRRRVAITVVVSVLGATIGVGGAGHAYLRRWRRAFAWFSLVLGAGLVLITSFADPETATISSLPLRVTAPLLVLLALNTLDAYRVAGRPAGERRASPSQEDPEHAASCPSCGRTLDSELPFCPWCARPLDSEADHE